MRCSAYQLSGPLGSVLQSKQMVCIPNLLGMNCRHLHKCRTCYRASLCCLQREAECSSPNPSHYHSNVGFGSFRKRSCHLPPPHHNEDNEDNVEPRNVEPGDIEHYSNTANNPSYRYIITPYYSQTIDENKDTINNEGGFFNRLA